MRDVCAAYVACIRRAETLPPGIIINLASGKPRRIGDILDRMLALSGVAATVQTGDALLRPSDIPMACGDARLALAALDWTAKIPWEQTLRDVLDDWTARIACDPMA